MKIPVQYLIDFTAAYLYHVNAAVGIGIRNKSQLFPIGDHSGE